MNAEQQARNLLKEKNYKKWLLIGIASLVIVVLLNSFLFTLILGIIKLALALFGVFALGYAGVIAWPEIKKRAKEENR